MLGLKFWEWLWIFSKISNSVCTSTYELGYFTEEYWIDSFLIDCFDLIILTPFNFIWKLSHKSPAAASSSSASAACSFMVEASPLTKIWRSSIVWNFSLQGSSRQSRVWHPREEKFGIYRIRLREESF